MARTYNSRRRTESAERTRQAIVEAAVRMHNQGITTMSAVAEEAGVSLPTVNKYFPTREDLFTACTGHVTTTVDYPSPQAIAAITDCKGRVQAAVAATFHLHEDMLGVSWTGYKLEDESPVMAKTMSDYEAFVGMMVDALQVERTDPRHAFAQALLSPLTYRVLRVKKGMDLDDAVHYTTQALTSLIDA